MNIAKAFIFILSVVFLAGCSQEKKGKFIIIKNTLNSERSFETIELTKEFLKSNNLNTVGIRNLNTGKNLVTQLVDNDGDGTMDELLFQPKLAPNSEKKYEIVQIPEKEKSKAEVLCYSRFVPERTDDYAWENDKVAFRVFGPKAQKMVEEGISGGTLSSGVDAWLKKVEYPIINKWYKKELETDGSYHEDTGEGLDNFHVGISRGVGGIAVKKDSTYYFSKNYSSWRTITTGPIRTSFYLEYENWDASGNPIKESRIISLDLGNSLSKFSIFLEGTPEISSGITLHKKDGEVTADFEKGWASYWRPHGDSELGTAIVAAKNYFKGFEKYDTEAQDLSNAYVHLNVLNNKVIYYAGFGWKKREEFNNKQEWEHYLSQFAERINSPLLVILK